MPALVKLRNFRRVARFAHRRRRLRQDKRPFVFHRPGMICPHLVAVAACHLGRRHRAPPVLLHDTRRCLPVAYHTLVVAIRQGIYSFCSLFFAYQRTADGHRQQHQSQQDNH